MDGLIKALSDVVIGGGGGHDGENEARDERSRSSWAQVVSGDQDNEERPPSQWRKQEQSQQDGEGWQVSGSRPSRRPQKAEYEGYEKDERDERHAYNQNEWSRKEQENENNDGWETVGRKPRRRPQKVHMDNWQGYKRAPSEQEYADEVGTGAGIEPSEEELEDLSQACNRLWQLDLNRLEPGKDYQIDCGEGKKVYQKEDMAEESLFYSLSEDIFRKPTFSRFCALLDNYNPNAGCKEVVTAEEKQEQSAFIEEISRTAPIKYLHRYLSLKGIVSENYQDFKRMLTKLWFDLYGRGGTSGSSSAFEHVFVGEIKQRGEEEVTGFHNWLQFYLEEAKGRVDYQGYILPRRRGETPDSETQLLTIQFEWNGVLKAVSSTLVGVSPEFELALYTLCLFVGGEDNHVQLGPYSVNIKCYRFGDKIGSVFPIAES
ncbi:hypothetical protein V6N13_036462 [Hibiscus sabdariffa]|uniref:EndoU domain-containing protein n=1 Tax=Hibiscus sabdariffa TaxID=183260 RepID=A0ABR2S6Z0_9ROSI